MAAAKTRTTKTMAIVDSSGPRMKIGFLFITQKQQQGGKFRDPHFVRPHHLLGSLFCSFWGAQLNCPKKNPP